MKKEQVNHPEHYGGKNNIYEAIKIIEALDLDFSLGNAFKYISRAGKKDPNKKTEDLKKAKWYISRAIRKSIKEEARITGFNLTGNHIDEIIEGNFILEQYIETKIYDVTIQPKEGLPYDVLFCELQSNSNIENYRRDPEIYFYGVSKYSLKDYINKPFNDDNVIIKKINGWYIDVRED